MNNWMLLLLLALLAKSTTASVNRQTYIIHMDKSKIPSPYLSTSNSEQWYQSLLSSIAESSSQEAEDGSSQETTPPQLFYTYQTVLSGFAAHLSPKEVQALSKIDGFLSAVPDKPMTLHTTHSSQFLGLQLGKGLWSTADVASDVIIGVIDTGVWPENPSFKDSGMREVPSRWKGACQPGRLFSAKNCNKKLIGARFYYKGWEAASGIKINDTIDYKSARDTNAHGTHTASTAGGSLVDNVSFYGLGNGTAAGMKYSARIAAYKACWPEACITSDMVAAIDQAVADGVDVLSVSIGGSDDPYYADSTAIALFGATEKGVFVSCSAGNSGPISAPVENPAPWIMTVGASYTDRSFRAIVKLGNGKSFIGSTLYAGKVTATKELPIVYGKTAGKSGAENCRSGTLDKKLVKGKLVVCYRSNVATRIGQGVEVKLAGGAGMLQINPEIAGEEALADAHVLPTTALGYLAGKALHEYISSITNPTGSISFQGTVYGDRAPRVAGFSSRGPSKVEPNLIKPDVIAPGVNIIAGFPPIVSPSEDDRDKRRVLFSAMSGTSMACPHVAGLAALLKSVHKDWSPAAIKSALMTTAYTLDNKHSPIVDVAKYAPATPYAMGSGHVDPERASNPGLIYDITTEDYLHYFCSLNYTSSQIAKVSRTKFTCPKNVVLQPGDLNYPSFSVNFKGKSKEVTYKRTLTNVGTPSSTYQVKVEEPSWASVVVKPYVLEFKKRGEKLRYSATFVGKSGKVPSDNYSFGSLTWVSGKYSVRSPIAVVWK